MLVIQEAARQEQAQLVAQPGERAALLLSTLQTIPAELQKTRPVTVPMLRKSISSISKYLEVEEPLLATQKKAALLENYNELANELRAQSVVTLQAVMVGDTVSMQQLEAALAQGKSKVVARIDEAHLKELKKPISVKQGMNPFSECLMDPST